MEEYREITHVEFQIICINTLPSKCGGTNPHFLSIPCAQWFPFNEDNEERKEEKMKGCQITVQKTDKHYVSQALKWC